MTSAFIPVVPMATTFKSSVSPLSRSTSLQPIAAANFPMGSASSSFMAPCLPLFSALCPPIPSPIPAKCPRVDVLMGTPPSSSSSSSSTSSSSSSTTTTTTTTTTSSPTTAASATVPKVLSQQEVEELAAFITNGPVYRTANLDMRPIDENDPRCFTDSFQTCMDDWLHMGAILEHELGPFANNVRVYQYYLPIYFWLLRELDRFADRLAADDDALPRPFIMGFCCPQGGGKTTMTTFMAKLLNKMGKKVEIASLDDFYVTHAEQNAIAQQHPDNPLMQYRGMPGTHDIDLLTDTLDNIRLGRNVDMPRYNKSAFQGRGDRHPRDKWQPIDGMTDVVLLEGWCLGFEPVPEHKLHVDHLAVVNKALEDFKEIYKRLDGLFLIEISDMDWVFDWRLQAERDSHAKGKPGLTDEQVMDFVSRFMPAYKQYSPQLYGRPVPLFPDHELHIEIDRERKPVHTPRSRL